MIRDYYRLAKPGIVYGNAMTAAAGFFLAANGSISISLFLAMLIGISLVMASACVFNNYLDRGIDSKMERTKNRSLISGKISPLEAIVYASLLGIAGFLLLFFWTTRLAALIALVGFVTYIGLYGYTKRHSVHGTVVGSISGAVPPVVGYSALSGKLDVNAYLLFLVLVFWQMPHFYAIAIYRIQDYKAAKIPVLPIVKGYRQTKMQILVYIAAFVLACLALGIFGSGGYAYMVVMLVLGTVWFRVAYKGISALKNTLWARKVFRFSLIVLVGFSIMVSINSFLPWAK